MTSLDPLDEQRAVRLRQRLWGAAVLIALAVIFLPLLLDGSGSESQYRRVERLREEPPRVITADGQVQVQAVPESAPNSLSAKLNTEPTSASQAQTRSLAETAQATQSAMQTETRISAWVVQAGSFKEEQNSIAVRDRLRSAGYPSFVSRAKQGAAVYRVRVGPMISYERALANRDKVSSIVGMESMVVSYP